MGTYLGQNFLIDAKVRQYIADRVLKLYTELGCEALIEIGPGKGSITKLIHQISKNFFVIEKDTTLKLHLNEILDPLNPPSMGTSNPPNPPFTRGQILWGDVLEIDIEKILKEKKLKSEKTLVVGNLPYYITSPILRKFFGEGHQNFAGGIFMVQDEVALRLDSEVKKKSYLRWLLNYAYRVKYLKGVPAKCFKPAPKVKSALIQLITNNLQLTVKFDTLIKFLDLYSPFTRKTLGKIQKMVEKSSKNSQKSLKEISNFTIPKHLEKKRLEELKWEELEEIL